MSFHLEVLQKFIHGLQIRIMKLLIAILQEGEGKGGRGIRKGRGRRREGRKGVRWGRGKRPASNKKMNLT